jgi:hypothetical protein
VFRIAGIEGLTPPKPNSGFVELPRDGPIMKANEPITMGKAWIDLKRFLIPGQGLVKAAQVRKILPDVT